MEDSAPTASNLRLTAGSYSQYESPRCSGDLRPVDAVPRVGVGVLVGRHVAVGIMSHAVFSKDIDSSTSTLAEVTNFESWDSKARAIAHAQRLSQLLPDMSFTVVDDDDRIVWPRQ